MILFGKEKLMDWMLDMWQVVLITSNRLIIQR